IMGRNRVKISYNEIFRYSDILNPVSQTALLAAGKLAELGPKKTVLDLGCGKGSPSLLWASAFGVQVEGYDLNKDFVAYANARARLLNLSSQARYLYCDVKELKVERTYDVIASLGLGIAHIYGSIGSALKRFRNMMSDDGFLILAEPVWLDAHIPSEVLNALGENKDSFLTQSELQQQIERHGCHIGGIFVSTKEDWALYVNPVYVALHEIVAGKSELTEDVEQVRRGFEAEYDAAGRYWNMVLWVIKAC
ncbi:MAG: methyltransferase domain-containing protein, partial [Candidatus Bathyarchaeota archaeon]